MKKFLFPLVASILISLAACNSGGGEAGNDLNVDLRFFGYPAADADIARGSTIFGLDPNTGRRVENCEPGSGCVALVEGLADDGETEIRSNGRVCTDCHRINANFQLGTLLPLTSTVPANDPLIEFVDADSQFHPDGLTNLQQHGLIVVRPYRFKGLPSEDPFRKFIAWRKIPTNFNLALGRGFVHDLRNPDLQDVDKSAFQSHTQINDQSFESAIDPTVLRDLEAFQFSLFTDPRLEALLYPGDDRFDPSYDELVNDPYLTVRIETEAQERGKEVFNRFCYTCHNVPNVFNNRANQDPTGKDPFSRQLVGQGYDIGVAQANYLHLDFRFFNQDTGELETVVLPLVRNDGEVVNFVVDRDPGLAAITKRFEDLFVFKVPQLRGLEAQGTYMHDNSIRSLEALVSYFNSPQFNNSAGGRAFPINMTAQEEADLVEFLKQL